MTNEGFYKTVANLFQDEDFKKIFREQIRLAIREEIQSFEDGQEAKFCLTTGMTIEEYIAKEVEKRLPVREESFYIGMSGS